VDKLKGLELPLGAFLFSIDINSLYTNIETSLGLRAIKQAFDRFPDPQRPDKEILDLLELSLLRKDFNFNDEFYLQIHGTAMGKKFAPAFANLYMGFWEETAFLKCQILPFLYLRYLDDIFGIWVSSMQDFECFLETLNTHHPAITTSHNIQREKLEFLDTQVLIVPSDGVTKSLATKVFFKETDRHALLHKASYHPKHTFRGIIKSQLIRFNRICTLGEHVEEATTIPFRALGPRGYSKRFLRGIKVEVRELFGREGGYNKTVETHNLIPFVTTYSGSLSGFGRNLRSNFREAQQAVEGLVDCRVISAYRRNKNLGDSLVHSAFQTKNVPNKFDKYLGRPKYIVNAFSGWGSS
jgi:hypothetical protein